jgi:hypothetical protein
MPLGGLRSEGSYSIDTDDDRSGSALRALSSGASLYESSILVVLASKESHSITYKHIAQEGGSFHTALANTRRPRFAPLLVCTACNTLLHAALTARQELPPAAGRQSYDVIRCSSCWEMGIGFDLIRDASFVYLPVAGFIRYRATGL